MSPAMRVLRTLFQVVLAEAAAVPGAVQLLGVDAGTSAKIGALCGFLVLVVSAAQNAIEHASGKALGAVPSAPPGGPVSPPAPPGGQGSPPGPGPLGPPPRSNEP